MPQRECCVSISTPSDQLQFNVRPNTLASTLLSQVQHTCSLREIWYFGLAYVQPGGKAKWAKPSKKIKFVGSPKESQKSFQLMIRCYPEDVSELIEDKTKRHFYSELKKKIIDGELYCSSEYALLLASYQAVINHGPYRPDIYASDQVDVRKYIPSHILEQHNLSDKQWVTKIAKLHEDHGEKLPEVAVEDYLKVVQDLDMYGVTYYPIKNRKGSSLWLGVDAVGISIYEHDNKLSAKVRFPYTEIRKIAHSGKKFTVKPVDSTATDVVVYCEDVNAAKDVLLLCSANHDLFKHRRQPESIAVQQMRCQADEERCRLVERWEAFQSQRKAHAQAEERCLKMERDLKRQESEYEYSQALLSEMGMRVKCLESQLEEEKRLRSELEAMRYHLDEINQQLEQQNVNSVEDLLKDREDVMKQIKRQQETIESLSEENSRLLTRPTADTISNNGHDEFKDSGERELQPIEGQEAIEDDRQARTVTDVDYDLRMKRLKADLDATRDPQKLQKIDIQYDSNLREGLDKYRTLRNIRSGNTKKRVEQFESM